MRHALVTLGCLALTGAVPAFATPSFDCRRAGTPTEGAICASPALARLDRQLADTYGALLDAFPPGPEAESLRADQRRWLRERDRCRADASCLTDTYRARLEELTGSGLDGLPGLYTGALGVLAIAPLPDGYVAAIATAGPGARWVCAYAGRGTTVRGSGNLAVVDADERSYVELIVAGDGTITVADDPDTVQAEAAYCGRGGRFSGTYRKDMATLQKR